MEKFKKPIADIILLNDDIICTSQQSGHESSDPDPTIIVDDE